MMQAALFPQRGYDIHHIVEKSGAYKDGFSEALVEGRENLVRVPTLKHWEITAWYMTKDEKYGGISPREYLESRGWEERVRVGQEAHARFGVLKR